MNNVWLRILVWKLKRKKKKERMIKMIVFLPNNGLWNCSNWQWSMILNWWLQSVPAIAWGKQTRVILDVGCGVASFGGYLFDRNVIAMSFAPKDEHEAQVQFALERGIPAISAVMGSQRLQFPSRVFDVVHCARCRVPWHADGSN